MIKRYLFSCKVYFKFLRIYKPVYKNLKIIRKTLHFNLINVTNSHKTK